MIADDNCLLYITLALTESLSKSYKEADSPHLKDCAGTITNTFAIRAMLQLQETTLKELIKLKERLK